MEKSISFFKQQTLTIGFACEIRIDHHNVLLFHKYNIKNFKLRSNETALHWTSNLHMDSNLIETNLSMSWWQAVQVWWVTDERNAANDNSNIANE